MSIEFRGLDNIYSKLDNIANTQKIETALGEACAIVERSAKQKAEKDTGALRRSIQSKVKDLEGIVYTPLEYAPYREYGTGLFAENGGRLDVPWNYQDDKGVWHKTSGAKPHPFMRPALNENRKKIIEILKEGLSND